MYSGYNGQRRGILRPVTATGGGPMFRNLPLFGFLTGLLLLFFVFYIYQAQNAELYSVRNQIELERSRHIKIKSENIDLKAQLEKYKSLEASLKNELQSERLSQKGCNEKLAKQDNILLSYTENLKQLQNDKNACFTAMASMKAELALAKLTITTMRTNFTRMGSAIEIPEKSVESLKTRLQGENAQENIRQEANLTISPLAVTKSVNDSKNRKDISTQDKKMLFRQGAILPDPVVPEHIIASITKPSNILADTIISVPQDKAQDSQFNFLPLPLQLEKQSLGAKNEMEPKFSNSRQAELNFDNVLDMNGQSPLVQHKNQMKKNTGNDNDGDGKQEIANDYGDNAFEDA